MMRETTGMMNVGDTIRSDLFVCRDMYAVQKQGNEEESTVCSAVKSNTEVTKDERGRDSLISSAQKSLPGKTR